MGLGDRILAVVGLAVAALFLVYFLAGAVVVLATVVALLAIAGFVLYIRLRLMVRRFRKQAKQMAAHLAEAMQADGAVPGSPPSSGNVLDADFRVEDKR